MKYLLILLLSIFTIKSNATIYYFSSSTGDDLRSPSLATNPSTPWKSLDKLNALLSNTVSGVTPTGGDQFLFKAGERFYGNITSPTISFNTPIIIGTYGTGKAIFTNLVKLTSWSTGSGNIYTTTDNISYQSTPHVLLINGVLQRIARWPDYTTTGAGGWLDNEDATNNTIVDNDWGSLTKPAGTPSNLGGTGTEIVNRSEQWVIEHLPIATQTNSGTSTTFTTTGSFFNTHLNYGYFLQNNPAFLNQDGEWYYNPTTKKIQLYSSVAIGSRTIEVANFDNLITLNSDKNITFQDLELYGTNVYGFYGYNTLNIVFNRCYMHGVGDDAFRSEAKTGSPASLTITNSSADQIGRILLSAKNYVNASSGFADIEDNDFRNVFQIHGLSNNNPGNGQGIVVDGEGIIKNNVLTNIGGNGIALNKGADNVEVSYNIIDNAANTTNDQGGIYSVNKTTGSETQYRPYTNRVIKYNIIKNVKGYALATSTTIFGSAGLYGDRGSRDAIYDHNTVINCTKGSLWNDPKNITLTNNLFYNYIEEGIRMDDFTANWPSGNVVNHNIFVQTTNASSSAQRYLYLVSDASGNNGVSGWGTFNNDAFIRPLVSTSAFRISGLSSPATLSQIRASPYFFELAGREEPFNSSTVFKLIVNEGDADVTYTLDGKTWKDGFNQPYNTNSVVVPAKSSLSLIQTGTITTPPTDAFPVVSLTAPASGATFTEPATITLTATATDNSSVTKVEFYNGTTLLGTDNTSPYTYVWSGVYAGDYTITAKATDNASQTTTSTSRTFTVDPVIVTPPVEPPPVVTPNTKINRGRFSKIKSF